MDNFVPQKYPGMQGKTKIYKMKKLSAILLTVFSVSLFSACVESTEPFDYQAQFELEKPIIAAYVSENMPNAIYHEGTSIWYEILNEGEENSYEYKVDSFSGQIMFPIVSINYEGRLLNGTLFDENKTLDGATFPLSSLIDAWKIAFLPARLNDVEVGGLTELGLQKSSVIRIVTPSLWGYQNNSQGKVPANAPLDFTITVLDIR